MAVEMDELLNTFLDEADEHLAALESVCSGWAARRTWTC